VFISRRKWHNLTVEIKQLESVKGFVIYDLPGADTYVGPSRLGAKLVPGNAEMLVRHQTYVFALAEQRKSGATIGLKVDPEDTDAAVNALAGELASEFESQHLLTSPGLRLNRESLGPILRHDKRNPVVRDNRDGVTFEDELLALGAVTCAAFFAKPSGKWDAAIEGFNQTGIGVAREIETQGGTVKRISTNKGCVSGNFDSATLADAWLEAGADCVEQLGSVEKAWTIWKSDVDAIFVGSKPGAMSGDGAKGVGETPIIATSAAAVSSKALAILRKNNTPVAADFLSNIGPALAWWAPEETSQDELRSSTSASVTGLLEETANHTDGSFMAACYKAEAFMESWQEQRPFGRPLG
jgi:glutamate dehydrogenase/leucine dehydrogenase